MEEHLTLEELEAGLAQMGVSPGNHGTLEMIVSRPAVGERVVMERAELRLVDGLVGDTWNVRSSSRTPDGSPHPEMQITLTNSRLMQLIARDRSRWPLAGDQLYVDLDLSEANLPPGQRIAIGGAVLEITPMPHTGCDKFSGRFGSGAIHFVNSPEGRQHRRRGLNARVIQAGVICVGDVIVKVSSAGLDGG
jgi:hypothetical protein